MADQITHYRVFIASPGGLEVERRVFRDALLSHNDVDAIERSCYFRPIGWEITLGGVGRPQDKINQDLRKCDYFVLVLWSRWGSPTGRLGVSSGTEEEFILAKELLLDPLAPMRDIIVFFRSVDAASLSDPGPQLLSVLDFRRQLEEKKELLFETFDSPESFGEKIKKHLASWTRVHGGVEGFSMQSPDSVVDIGEQIATLDLAPDANLTDLESELAFNMVTLRSMTAFDRYGKFLAGQDRFVDAQRVYRDMYELAVDVKELRWASTAIARLGGIYRSQGKIQEAEQLLQRALGMKLEQDDRVGESMVRTFLADLYFRRNEPVLAVEHYRAALTANPDLREPALSTIKYKIARAYLEIDDKDSATLFLSEANEGAVKSKNQKLIKSIKQLKKARRLA